MKKNVEINTKNIAEKPIAQKSKPAMFLFF